MGIQRDRTAAGQYGVISTTDVVAAHQMDVGDDAGHDALSKRSCVEYPAEVDERQALRLKWHVDQRTGKRTLPAGRGNP